MGFNWAALQLVAWTEAVQNARTMWDTPRARRGRRQSCMICRLIDDRQKSETEGEAIVFKAWRSKACFYHRHSGSAPQDKLQQLEHFNPPLTAYTAPAASSKSAA